MTALYENISSIRWENIRKQQFEQKSKCISISSLSASQQYPHPSATANAARYVGGSKIKQFALTSAVETTNADHLYV